MGLNNGDINHERNYAIVLLIFMLMPISSYAASSFGTTTAEFLKIKAEAGPAGMGEAYTALCDDTAAMIYNPSGLGLLNRMEITAAHILWFDSIPMEYAAFAVPLEPGMGLGINFLWIDFGNFDSTGFPENAISAQDLIVTAGFGKNLGDVISLGVNAKFIYEHFAEETSIGTSFDAGAIIKILSKNLTLGLTAKNFGFLSGTNDSFPMELGAGMGFKLFNGREDFLNIGVDVSKILATDNWFLGAGIEATAFSILSARLGFRYNPAFEPAAMSFSDPSRMIMLSAGAGINVSDFSINFAYTPMGDLNQIMRFEIKMKFGESISDRPSAGKKSAAEPKEAEAAKDLEDPKINVENGRIKSVSFKPNVPQEKVKEWSLNIKSPDGKIVKSFSGVGEVPKNLEWDGTDSFGKIAKADANYIFDFQAKDMENQTVRSIVNTILPKKYDYIKTEEKRFVPRKGREMLVAPVTLLVSSDVEARKSVPFLMVNDKIKDVKNWAFDVYDRAGVPVKKFKGEGSMSSYLVWDGKDYDGNYVEGLKTCRYVLTVNGTNGKITEIKERKVIREPFIIASKTKKLKMAKRIYFDTDDFAIIPEMADRLNEIGAEISKQKRTQVYIQGHSSAEGDRLHNILLSQQRAKAVLRYLVEKYGISPLSITTVGYGSDIPVDSQNDENTRAHNRRVEIIIMGETK